MTMTDLDAVEKAAKRIGVEEVERVTERVSESLSGAMNSDVIEPKKGWAGLTPGHSVGQTSVKTDYNGWTNWETWDTFNWISSDETHYPIISAAIGVRDFQDYLQDYVTRVFGPRETASLLMDSWNSFVEKIDWAELARVVKGD